MADKRKLSRISETIVQDFAATAQAWGWQADQGHGPQVGRSKAAFSRAETRLRRRLLRLERAVTFAQGVADVYRKKLEEGGHG